MQFEQQQCKNETLLGKTLENCYKFNYNFPIVLRCIDKYVRKDL